MVSPATGLFANFMHVLVVNVLRGKLLAIFCTYVLWKSNIANFMCMYQFTRILYGQWTLDVSK